MINLRLDRVKMCEVVEHLVLSVIQGADWKRLKVEQFRVRRMSLGQEEMLEAQRQYALCE